MNMEQFIIKKFKEVIKELDGKKIAIFGLGRHTKIIINYLNSIEANFLIECIVDDNVDCIIKELYGYKVENLKQLYRYNVDTILISSLSYEDKIYNRIKNSNYNIKKIYNSHVYFINNEFYTEGDIKKTAKESSKINIGGGNWFKEGWLNVDWYAEEIFISHKINLLENQNLPYENASIEKVFCSHLIEHLSNENVYKLLEEIYRIMKKGGIVRIACPDADKAFEAYFNKIYNFFNYEEVLLVGNNIERKLVNFFASYKLNDYIGGPIVNEDIIKKKVRSLNKEQFIKWCVYLIPKEAEYVAHINGWYYSKLYKVLSEIGFKGIIKSSFRESEDLELRGQEFDNRPNHSLYIECKSECDKNVK